MEDNRVNQKIACAMLDRAGYQSTVAADGASALALFANQAFDLILMDVQLPGLDSLQVTQRIRADDRQTDGTFRSLR